MWTVQLLIRADGPDYKRFDTAQCWPKSSRRHCRARMARRGGLYRRSALGWSRRALVCSLQSAFPFLIARIFGPGPWEGEGLRVVRAHARHLAALCLLVPGRCRAVFFPLIWYSGWTIDVATQTGRSSLVPCGCVDGGRRHCLRNLLILLIPEPLSHGRYAFRLSASQSRQGTTESWKAQKAGVPWPPFICFMGIGNTHRGPGRS